MRQDPMDGTLKPFDFSQIVDEVPELGKYAVKIDSYTFDPLIDSSDVEPGLWQSLASLIKERYDEYDGFVVLHGTDTMAYSASALSFMELQRLGDWSIGVGGVVTFKKASLAEVVAKVKSAYSLIPNYFGVTGALRSAPRSSGLSNLQAIRR